MAFVGHILESDVGPRGRAPLVQRRIEPFLKT